MNGKKSSRPSRSVAADPLLTSDAQLTETAALLTFASTPVTPPAQVKSRLLARIRAHGATKAAALAGWKFSKTAADEGWGV